MTLEVAFNQGELRYQLNTNAIEFAGPESSPTCIAQVLAAQEQPSRRFGGFADKGLVEKPVQAAGIRLL